MHVKAIIYTVSVCATIDAKVEQQGKVIVSNLASGN